MNTGNGHPLQRLQQDMAAVQLRELQAAQQQQAQQMQAQLQMQVFMSTASRLYSEILSKADEDPLARMQPDFLRNAAKEARRRAAYLMEEWYAGFEVMDPLFPAEPAGG